MKCPKCSYLGFETGDRCKNCGYDFSLLPADDPYADEIERGSGPDAERAYDINADLMLNDPSQIQSSQWLDEVDAVLRRPDVVEPSSEPPRLTLAPEPTPVETPPVEPPAASQGLPLFTQRVTPDDDEPLISVPAAPRPPLSVRRAPDLPRPHIEAKHLRRQTPDRDHVLLFGEELGVGEPRQSESVIERERSLDIEIEHPIVQDTPIEMTPIHVAPMRVAQMEEQVEQIESPQISDLHSRVVAALIDHSILLTIDFVVLYFTLRMAALTLSDLDALPLAPLLAFLGFIKLAYFSAFTTVGGQTIGKMAAGIRVVSDDEGRLDLGCAIQRAATVLVSLATLGIGFIPALFGPDRRALHDRLARTRVITLSSV